MHYTADGKASPTGQIRGGRLAGRRRSHPARTQLVHGIGERGRSPEPLQRAPRYSHGTAHGTWETTYLISRLTQFLPKIQMELLFVWFPWLPSPGWKAQTPRSTKTTARGWKTRQLPAHGFFTSKACAVGTSAASSATAPPLQLCWILGS